MSKANLGGPERVTVLSSSGTLRDFDGGSPGKNIGHSVPGADPDVQANISWIEAGDKSDSQKFHNCCGRRPG